MTTLYQAYEEVAKAANEAISDEDAQEGFSRRDVSDEFKQKVISQYEDMVDALGMNGEEIYQFCRLMVDENREMLIMASLLSKLEGRSMLADAYMQGMQTGLMVGAVYMKHQIEETRKAVEGDA